MTSYVTPKTGAERQTKYRMKLRQEGRLPTADERRAGRHKYYLRNRALIAEKAVARYAANKEKILAYHRAHYRNNKEKLKAKCREYRNRVGKYGVTPDIYQAMLAAQSGVCAICLGHDRNRKKTKLTIDHDHKTGTVRGLLCSTCNSALGLFKDDEGIILAAASYLARSRK